MLQAQTLDPDCFSLLGQVQFRQKINRKWRCFLSSVERDVMDYLVDNTIAWQRTTLHATLEQMVMGTHWLPKIGLSVSTIQRAMGELVRRGLVWVHSASKRAVKTYEINMTWEPPMASRAGIAVPKRMQARTEGNVVSGVFGNFGNEPEPMVENIQVNLTYSVGQIETPLKEKALKGKLEENTSYSQPVSQGSETSQVKPVATLTQPSLPLLPRIRTRPVAPIPVTPTPVAARPLPKSIRSVTNDIAWRKAWDEGFPGAPRKLLLPMERGMLQKARVRIEAMNIKWFEFFEWSVINWRHVMAEKFGWMTKKPAPQYPDVMFLCTGKFTNSFLEAYAARKEQDSIKVLRGEAADVARMKAAGMSETQIAFELGRTRAFQDQRQRNEADEAHIALQMHSLKMAEARLKVEREVVLAQAAKGRPAFSLARPAINHGDNHYENPDAAIPEFTTVFGAFE
jgi:hypothetical protein